MPIDPLAKILCVGMNYRDHVGEINQEIATYPSVFTRSLDTLVASGQSIVRPKISETFNFEGKIAIMIGREAGHVALNDAMAYVGG